MFSERARIVEPRIKVEYIITIASYVRLRDVLRSLLKLCRTILLRKLLRDASHIDGIEERGEAPGEIVLRVVVEVHESRERESLGDEVELLVEVKGNVQLVGPIFLIGIEHMCIRVRVVASRRHYR